MKFVDQGVQLNQTDPKIVVRKEIINYNVGIAANHNIMHDDKLDMSWSIDMISFMRDFQIENRVSLSCRAVK